MHFHFKLIRRCYINSYLIPSYEYQYTAQHYWVCIMSLYKQQNLYLKYRVHLKALQLITLHFCCLFTTFAVGEPQLSVMSLMITILSLCMTSIPSMHCLISFYKRCSYSQLLFWWTKLSLFDVPNSIPRKVIHSAGSGTPLHCHLPQCFATF